MSKLISIEGSDGTGKTTQSLALVNNLKNHNKEAILAREPGGTDIGETLRKILKNDTKIEPISELLLFQAARTELIEKIILPALKSNKIVVVDRYKDSTLAYQGFGRGLDIELINLLNNISTQNLEPDLTILLDMPVEEAINRTTQRQQVSQQSIETNFEDESIDFHTKVSNGFRTLAKKSDKWVIVNGSLDINQISEIIWKSVEQLFD